VNQATELLNVVGMHGGVVRDVDRREPSRREKVEEQLSLLMAVNLPPVVKKAASLMKFRGEWRRRGSEAAV
jgi:hypothetical protein